MFRVNEAGVATSGFAGPLERVLAGDLPLEIHFQPIVDLARGTVTGYEALSRFPAEFGAPPDQWFAAAAQMGVSEELERLALTTILRHRGQVGENCFLTLNLGPDAVMAGSIQEAFTDEGDLRGLVIEITEQSPVEDYEALANALVPLRQRGAALAIDDTGAGYSSMRHIVALEPQFVKLDRSLVYKVDEDPRRSAAIAALGAFASELDAWVVAEGIETAEELAVLSSLEMPLAQGFFLGRPAPEMAPIDPGLQRLIRERSDREGRGVGALMQMTRAVRPTDPPEAAFLASTASQTAVRVDEYDRPTALLVNRDGQIEELPVLSTQPGTTPGELALRAMARESGHRFLPAAICDGRGRLLGLLPIDRLVMSLARD